MVLTRVKVDDFDQFWSVFSTKGAAKRKQHNSRGATVLHSTEDPQQVFVLFDWDEADFKAFLEDPETPEIMKEGGLQAPPDPSFVEKAGELDS
jgi:heme-degrading monooxygenase HmoA